MKLLRRDSAGFTLIEMLIALAFIGILSAIVISALQDQSYKAKEAVAKETLQKLRNVIELYAVQHRGYPPGYVNKEFNASESTVIKQLCSATNSDGQDAPLGTEGFPLGQYLPEIPENPFNNNNTIIILASNAPLPAKADDATGWIYKPATKTIRLNYSGTDSGGARYYDY